MEFELEVFPVIGRKIKGELVGSGFGFFDKDLRWREIDCRKRIAIGLRNTVGIGRIGSIENFLQIRITVAVGVEERRKRRILKKLLNRIGNQVSIQINGIRIVYKQQLRQFGDFQIKFVADDSLDKTAYAKKRTGGQRKSAGDRINRILIVDKNVSSEDDRIIGIVVGGIIGSTVNGSQTGKELIFDLLFESFVDETDGQFFAPFDSVHDFGHSCFGARYQRWWVLRKMFVAGIVV